MMGFRSGCFYVVARIYVERFIFSFSIAYRPGQGENGFLPFQQCKTQHNIQKTKIDLGRNMPNAHVVCDSKHGTIAFSPNIMQPNISSYAPNSKVVCTFRSFCPLCFPSLIKYLFTGEKP